MTKSIVLLSGGPDSATALAYATQQYDETRALHLNYGQINAQREQVAAKKIANHYNLPIEIANIEGLKDIFLDKIGDAIDYNVGCWEVLPFMLGFPITIAVSYGLTLNASIILLGVHATDVKDHPEYRSDALGALERAIQIVTQKPIKIVAPFIEKTKAELITIGTAMNAPYEKTWSCLLGGLVHCGKCWGCARRKLAFQDAAVSDPTEYEYKKIIKIANIDLTSAPSGMGLIFPEEVLARKSAWQ